MLRRLTSSISPFNGLRWDLDRLWDAFTPFTETPFESATPFPALNVWEEGKHFVAEAELPGLSLEDIELNVVGNELHLKGRRQPPEEKWTYHRRERGAGAFSRVLTLPVDIDADKVEATLKHGVLTITLPKAPEALARKIAIKTD